MPGAVGNICGHAAVSREGYHSGIHDRCRVGITLRLSHFRQTHHHASVAFGIENGGVLEVFVAEENSLYVPRSNNALNIGERVSDREKPAYMSPSAAPLSS